MISAVAVRRSVTLLRGREKGEDDGEEEALVFPSTLRTLTVRG